MTDPAGPDAVAHFAKVAELLSQRGLATPHILAQDEGFAVLEDMGTRSVSFVLEQIPDAAPDIYAQITDLLVRLHKAPPPGWLTRFTPDHAASLIAPLSEHYARGFDLAPVRAALTTALSAQGGGPLVIAHRDFHAENLIWRAGETGLARVGVLDFQDAVAAPPAYDIASLIRDARRDTAPQMAELVLTRYVEATGADRGALDAACAVWAVQRNLRILGIFARLCETGKRRYQALMPRVWRHLQADLAHPALTETATALRTLPPPKDRP